MACVNFSGSSQSCQRRHRFSTESTVWFLLVLRVVALIDFASCSEAKRDYYEVLNVKHNADAKTIKQAYRKLALKWHPDKNPGDLQHAEKEFRDVAEAFEVLSDEQSRKNYDQFGHEGVASGVASGFNADDLFKEMFGDEDPLADFSKFFEDIEATPDDVEDTTTGSPTRQKFDGRRGSPAWEGIKWSLLVGALAFYALHMLWNSVASEPSSQKHGAKADEPSKSSERKNLPSPREWLPGTETPEVKRSSSFFPFACCVSRSDNMDEEAVKPPPILSSAQKTPTHSFQPTVPGVDVVDACLCEELRVRLADILGPPVLEHRSRSGYAFRPASVGIHTSEEDDAARTVERYGGERSCFSRFLRARNLNVRRAEAMFRETIEFRRRHCVNEILQEPLSQAVWKVERPFWPMSTPIFTNDGSLVVYFRMAHLIGIYNKGHSEERIRTIYLCMMECCLRLQHEGRRRRGQGPTDELPPVYEIYDLQGIGVEHFRCIIGLHMLPRVLSIGQKHYPENLRAAVVLSTPRGFEPVWNFVRKVLHERTQAKIHITASDGRDFLSDVLGVSAEGVDGILGSIVPYSKGTSDSSGIIVGSDLMASLEQPRS